MEINVRMANIIPYVIAAFVFMASPAQASQDRIGQWICAVESGQDCLDRQCVGINIGGKTIINFDDKVVSICLPEKCEKYAVTIEQGSGSVSIRSANLLYAGIISGSDDYAEIYVEGNALAIGRGKCTFSGKGAK